MKIYKGVYTQFVVHLEELDMTDVSKVVLTIKNKLGGNPVIVREYTSLEEVTEIITPEEADMLEVGAKYDFDIIRNDGKRFKITENASVDIERGVGHVDDDSEQ